MSVSIQEITQKVLSFPELEQQEVADFVSFLESKIARQQLENSSWDDEGLLIHQQIMEQYSDVFEKLAQ